MTVNLPPDLDLRIQQRMATGHYATEVELFREAFQALEWREQEIAAIQEGVEDMEAGRSRSLEEVDADIRRKYGFRLDL